MNQPCSRLCRPVADPESVARASLSLLDRLSKIRTLAGDTSAVAEACGAVAGGLSFLQGFLGAGAVHALLLEETREVRRRMALDARAAEHRPAEVRG